MYARVRRLFSIYAAYHLPMQKTAGDGRLARLQLLPGFLWAGARAFPAALRWVRHRDPAARARVKQLLDLSGPAPVALDAALFAAKRPVVPPEDAAVTIVMPVHGGLALATEALERVACHTDIPWRIVIVDDASPDPAVRPALRDWAAGQGDRARLVALDVNLGFVGAVNIGLQQALSWPDPVVILNTDAFVPQGWAARLLRPLWEDDSVASVTPLSNDAELGSVPLPGRARGIVPAVADAVDAFAATLNGAAAEVAAPAGVGFCMALSPRHLAANPRFDEAFAPGYGEEVDWCRKTQAAGGRHIYVPDLFVAHIGGQSFGSERKQALIRRNSEILTRRYPTFDAEVHGFLRRDPLVTARLALGLARAEAERGRTALPIHMAHSMGGGAEIDLQRRIASDIAGAGASVVIRTGGVFRFTLELWIDGTEGPESVAGGTGDWDLVARLLAPVTARHLVYGCAVGDPDPVALPALFSSLYRRETDQLTVLMHDYFPLSPSMSLLSSGDRWRGLPAPDTTDPRHVARRPDGRAVPLAEWRAEWGRLMRAADAVVCFSAAAQALTDAACPGARTVLRPHVLHADVPRIDPPQGGRTVIGILGNLAPQKGAGVAEALSRHLAGRRDVALVHLGTLDPAYRLHQSAVAHGAYSVADLPGLVARHGITCWLIPSLWPETFSFTTHEALATGLPVVVFDLGGQGDAVRAAMAAGAPGAVLPLEDGAAPTPEVIAAAALRLSGKEGA